VHCNCSAMHCSRARQPRLFECPRTERAGNVYRCVSAEVVIRVVSELCHMATETAVKHSQLPGHVHADRCCAKLLTGPVLVGFDARQHARRESISKRAPSTTRTSLPFRINHLQLRLNRQNPELCQTLQCLAITPMRGLAVKSPAVSAIDMHTSLVAAEAGASRQEPGPRRRLPHVQIIQERSRP
jgi:hypothetical protein